MDEEVPVPPQLKLPALHDFRGAPTAQRGFLLKNKRKLDDYADQVAADEAAMEDGEQIAFKQPPKRQKLDTSGVGRISGRGWKQPGTRAGQLKNQHLATSWEKKMQNKAEAKLFKEQKTAAHDEHKAKLSTEKERRRVAKERKEANQKKNLKMEKISNPATLKRMMASKKQRKLLVTADPSAL